MPKRFLDQQKRAIEQRLREIKPYVDEAEQLERVLRALNSAGNTPSSRPPARKARRNMRLADRKAQVVALIADYPGIRRKDVAESLEITAARAGQIVNALLVDGVLRDEAGSLFVQTREDSNG